MGRPKGSKNITSEVKTESSKAGSVQIDSVGPISIQKPMFVETDNAKAEKAKEEQKGTVLEPLGPTQAYFESPEGEIIIGEASKDQIWSRKMNGGKGGWINKRR